MQSQALHYLNEQRGLAPAPPSCAPAFSAEQRQLITQLVLSAHAQQESKHLRSDRTWRDYLQQAAAFDSFLARWGSSWDSCDPTAVLIYIHFDLLPKHPGRGGGAPSASAVNGLISALSRVFHLRGRDQAWSNQNCSGNPVRSDLISNFKECYARQRQQAGTCERSAVPMRQERHNLMMQHLASEVAAAEQSGQVQLAGRHKRDAALLACLWAHARRGADMLNCYWGGLFVPGNPDQLAVSHWAAGLPACKQLYLVPRQDKTTRKERVGTLVLTQMQPDACCPVYWLREHCVHQARHGTLDGPIFGAMDNKGQRALSSSALRERFKRTLANSGPDHGETVHGMRRGRLQHEQAAGATDSDMRLLSGIRTDKTLQRYLDPGRHLAVQRDNVPLFGGSGGRAPRRV